jgi:hypothetical protein
MSKENGRFEKGNEIGKETRFKPKNELSLKYKVEYAYDMLKFFEESEEVVFVEDWAISRHISVRSVYNWIADEEKYPRFALYHRQAMANQFKKLAKGGLNGTLNARLVEFMLKNNHGMTDKTEQKIESDNTVSVEIKVVD